MKQNKHYAPIQTATQTSISGIPEKPKTKRSMKMGKVKTAWQAEQEAKAVRKYNEVSRFNHATSTTSPTRPTPAIYNDPYNLWDNDDHNTQAIDLNDFANNH